MKHHSVNEKSAIFLIHHTKNEISTFLLMNLAFSLEK